MDTPVLVAFISAVIGSAVGAAAALSRFRRERSFDRQVDWYEKSVRALFDLAQGIEVAITFQEEGRYPAHIQTCWREVQKAHLAVDRLTLESHIYGSADARAAMGRINDRIQEVADASNAFDPASIDEKERAAALERIEALPAELRHAALPLAAEARKHLHIP